MSIRKAYQTLEDRDIHRVESEGPFQCTHASAWLGNGYYFWESFIENAHWWGIDGAKYSNGYIICESTFILDENKCFNLVDNPDHLAQFNECRNILRSQNLYEEGKTRVSRIINYVKGLGVFNYEAIRVYGINSVSFRSKYANRTVFKHGHGLLQYLDSTPAIQINFFSKNSLNRTGFKIVFPVEYSEGYVV